MPATMHVSDEAKQETLDLARQEGEAYRRALEYMTTKEAHGQTREVGDYVVGWAQEKAEGLYLLDRGAMTWHEPRGDAHLEIVVCDRADHRFVPGLEVTASLAEQGGRELGSYRMEFLWHPWLYHYGSNVEVPGPGRYDLTVRIEPPRFGRHDKTNGRRYAEPVEVRFDAIEIKPGQKHSTDHLAR